MEITAARTEILLLVDPLIPPFVKFEFPLYPTTFQVTTKQEEVVAAVLVVCLLSLCCFPRQLLVTTTIKKSKVIGFWQSNESLCCNRIILTSSL